MKRPVNGRDNRISLDKRVKRRNDRNSTWYGQETGGTIKNDSKHAERPQPLLETTSKQADQPRQSGIYRPANMRTHRDNLEFTDQQICGLTVTIWNFTGQAHDRCGLTATIWILLTSKQADQPRHSGIYRPANRRTNCNNLEFTDQ